jgi:hypothetical protein
VVNTPQLNHQLNWTELPASKLHSLITPLHGPHGNHSLCCWQTLLTSSLLSNRYPLVPRVCFCGNMFSDPLTSNRYGAYHIENTSYSPFSIVFQALPRNGSTCHTIFARIYFRKQQDRTQTIPFYPEPFDTCFYEQARYYRWPDVVPGTFVLYLNSLLHLRKTIYHTETYPSSALFCREI